MKTPPVTVVLDGEDAAIVGATLRALGRTSKCPDLTVGARLVRVGDQLFSAAQLAGVLAEVQRG